MKRKVKAQKPRPAQPPGEKPVQAPSEKPAPSQGQERPSRYLALALWFALVTGFWELGFLAVRVNLHGHVLSGASNPHLPWLTLLAEFIVFGTIGLALFLISWWRPR